jgi:hypothetical protein
VGIMLFNVLFGFVIPSIFGFLFYRRNKRTVMSIYPIASIVAIIIGFLGQRFNFWRFNPVFRIKILSTLPFHLGVYPVLSSYLFHLIQKYKKGTFILIIAFSLITTILEYITLIIGKVKYYNKWNIYWTYVSYLFAYVIVYCYYRIFLTRELKQ